MPEIEFLEADEPEGPEPIQARPTRLDRRTALALLPAALALAATGLAAWAPFRWIYTLTESSSATYFTRTSPGSGQIPVIRVHADAWGRIFGDPGGFGSDHGVRFGIVAEVGAGLALCAAAALAAAVLSPNTRLRSVALRTGRAAGLLSAGVAGAVSASSYLAYVARRDELVTAARAAQAQQDGQSIQISTPHIGSGDSWLVAAGGALVAVIAVVLSLATARDARDRDDVGSLGSQRPQNLGTYAAGNTSAGDEL